MILVTGATGKNGTEILKRLSGRGEQIRAMVRKQKGKTFDITGPEALTHREMAAQLSQARDHRSAFLQTEKSEAEAISLEPQTAHSRARL